MSRYKTGVKGSIERVSEEAIYEQVADEMDAGSYRNGLKAKALADSNGDPDTARALYVKYRVQSILDEFEISNAQEAAVAEQKRKRENREMARRRQERTAHDEPKKQTRSESRAWVKFNSILFMLFIGAIAWAAFTYTLPGARDLAQMTIQSAEDGSSSGKASSPSRVSNIKNDKLVNLYRTEIQSRVFQMWQRPNGLVGRIICRATVIQLPSGEINDVVVSFCAPNNQALIRSIENAAWDASPLPAASHPSVFDRQLDLKFIFD